MADLQIRDRVQTGMISVKMADLQIGDRVQTGMKSVKMADLYSPLSPLSKTYNQNFNGMEILEM